MNFEKETKKEELLQELVTLGDAIPDHSLAYTALLQNTWRRVLTNEYH